MREHSGPIRINGTAKRSRTTPAQLRRRGGDNTFATRWLFHSCFSQSRQFELSAVYDLRLGIIKRPCQKFDFITKWKMTLWPFLPLCAASWRCNHLRWPSAGCPPSWPQTRALPPPWRRRFGWWPAAGARCGAAGQAEGPVHPRPPGAPPCQSLWHKRARISKINEVWRCDFFFCLHSDPHCVQREETVMHGEAETA